MAIQVLTTPREYLWDILSAASMMKRNYFDDHPLLCTIINAKSGACPEDCAFCSQSRHHSTGVPSYSLKPTVEILRARDVSARLPVQHFGVVTSGRRLSRREVSTLAEMIGSHPPKSPPAWCASLGALPEDELRELKQAGLKRFHHNLETAASYFCQICTTHNFDDRVRTIQNAQRAGLEICSGGILGMGESLRQRVELACTLHELEVNSIPINFLIPLPGTRLQSLSPIRPLEALLAVAMFRLTNPRAEIKVCAGRVHLRDLQSLIFAAGANGMMIGDLLTVAGRNVAEDLQMLRDLELLPDEE